jgi:hypothetical protein
MQNVIYLVHSKEQPEERDLLFNDLSKAEAYVRKSLVGVRDVQIKTIAYELSPDGVKDVMNYLKDFYLQKGG